MSRKRDIDDVRELIETKGIRAAANALIDVCLDAKAPAPARATAGTALLRAAGLFDKIERDDDKPPAEMTGEELQRRIARLRAEASRNCALMVDPPGDDAEEGEDLFE